MARENYRARSSIMTGDAEQVIVVTVGAPCPAASATHVHHRGFPEIHAEGPSALEAAEALLRHYASTLDDTPNHWHRGALQQALADVRAFVRIRSAHTSRGPGVEP